VAHSARRRRSLPGQAAFVHVARRRRLLAHRQPARRVSAAFASRRPGHARPGLRPCAPDLGPARRGARRLAASPFVAIHAAGAHGPDRCPCELLDNAWRLWIAPTSFARPALAVVLRRLVRDGTRDHHQGCGVSADADAASLGGRASALARTLAENRRPAPVVVARPVADAPRGGAVARADAPARRGERLGRAGRIPRRYSAAPDRRALRARLAPHSAVLVLRA